MRLEPDLDLARRFAATAGIPGRLLLAGITGSHHYGFPSPDSDLDIKAIHLAPTETLLGLSPPEKGFDRIEVCEGTECDLTSNEARQALLLLLKGNGNMLERILCPYQLIESEEVEALQGLAREAVCRRFHGHYSGFFRAKRQEIERAEQPMAKSVLYAYRVGVTGLHLLGTGQLEADLSALAEPYGLAEVLPLIEEKRAGAEKLRLSRREAAQHQADLDRLQLGLDEARDASPLPEEPPNADACEAWLVERRREELDRSR
jgi:predicted nucleotidyltransferase